MTVSLPMPRLHLPSRSQFAGFVEQRMPVVIEGALDSWKARSSWTFEHLKALIGETTVSVQARPRGDTGEFRYENVRFDAFIDSLTSRDECNYLAGFPLLDRFPALREDVDTPRYAGPLTVSPRAYIGPPGSLSPLHFDLSHGLSAQIAGRKKVVVLEFRKRDIVRGPELRRPGWLIEPLDVESAEPKGPRGVVPSRRWESTLEPGDLVFLPSRRHHHLRSLTASISLSFFWHTVSMRILKRGLALLGRPVM